VRGHRDRDRGVDPGQLFDRDRIRERVAAGAAVLFRDRDAHESELRELGDDFVGEAVLPVELFRDRGDPFRCELANRPADELVLLREVEVHAASRCASSPSKRTPNPVAPTEA